MLWLLSLDMSNSAYPIHNRRAKREDYSNYQGYVAAWQSTEKVRGDQSRLDNVALHTLELPEELASKIMDHELKRSKAKPAIHESMLDGTPGEVLSSHGNAKINLGRNIHTSSQRPHHRQVPRLKP
ncbi:hypothetical protein Tco_0565568 [Tanacetum coccineum]